MPQQRDTSTDRLLNVIQVIQLGRKSGLLSVERGEGIQYEEGMVLFVNGQATQASTGQRTGLDAFNWLSTWQACRFSFVPAPTVPTTALPTPPGMPNTPTATYIDTNAQAQSHQIITARQRAQQSIHGQLQAPQNSSGRQSSSGRLQAPQSSNGHMQAQRISNGRLQAQQSTNGHMHTPQPAMNRQADFPQAPEVRETDRSTRMPALASTRPVRTRLPEDGFRIIEQAGFTRSHRHLFLLIDGSRNVAELVHLMRREPHEVQILLNELEDAGLIIQL